MKKQHAIFLLAACAALASSGPAGAAPMGLADCANVPDPAARLACFDELAARYKPGPAPATAPASPVPATAQPASPPQEHAPVAVQPDPRPQDAVPASAQLQPPKAEPSYLQRHWELGAANKRGVLQFRSHEANYLVAKYSTAPNDAPYQAFRPLTGGTSLSHFELAYQIGFKMKLVEEAFGTGADLWAAYTQTSLWQAANERASSPFRETNYTPELMAVIPLDFMLLGFKGRFVNLGLVHQSNGQGSVLSRSWNRAYAQVGLERGGLSVLGRAWYRIPEKRATDDNPDITDYLGHGDLVVAYRRNGHELSLLTRWNPRTGRGAAQLAWGFPIAGKVLGYVQLFNGYGQSLVDYNHHENTLGVGFQVNY